MKKWCLNELLQNQIFNWQKCCLAVSQYWCSYVQYENIILQGCLLLRHLFHMLRDLFFHLKLYDSVYQKVLKIPGTMSIWVIPLSQNRKSGKFMKTQTKIFIFFKALYWEHIISRQECMASWGTPISATFIAKFAEIFGPIVEPHLPSWRTIRSLIYR